MRRSTDPAAGGTSGGGAAKKKFGKNLNKLVKPAAPPIVSNSGANNARNGLLLLSTKKAANKESTGPGLLSKQPPREITVSATTTPAVTITTTTSKPAYEAKAASTHDVLLSAVKGASLEPQAPLDAWGVQQSSSSKAEDDHGVADEELMHDSMEPTMPQYAEEAVVNNDDETNNAHITHVAPSWDEYGGRDAVRTSHNVYVPVSSAAPLVKPVQQVAMIQQRPQQSLEDDAKAEKTHVSPKMPAKVNRQEVSPRLEPPVVASRVNAVAAPVGVNTSSETRHLWVPDSATTAFEKTPVMKKEAEMTANARDNYTSKQNGQAKASTTQQPVIHVSSYDDRNRGEQDQQKQATRMLYDPKSGSMVAVSSSMSKKECGPRSANKPSNAIRKNPRHDSKEKGGSPSAMTAKNVKYNGAPDRSQFGSAQLGSNGNAEIASKSDCESHRRFPRTCGVLYARDDKGNLYCVDGCEGDYGFGMHSVPGGRIKNAVAFAEYNKRESEQGSNGRYGTSKYSTNGANVTLYTRKVTAAEEEEFLSPEPLEYVRADDKLELVTGMDDDTPTLKPTAREWAPSQAALAAAAAARLAEKTMCATSDAGAEILDDSFDDDDDGPLGLGFDPTQDIDFDIESPSRERREVSRLDLMKMSAMSLEPSADRVDGDGPRHLFAFGSSGTWGAKADAAVIGAGEWELPRSDTGGLFGSGMFQTQTGDNSDPTAAAFINISGSTAWSTGPLGNNSLAHAPAGIE